MGTTITRGSLIRYYQSAINQSLARYQKMHGSKPLTLQDFANPSIQRKIAAHPELASYSLDLPQTAITPIDIRNVNPASIRRAQDILLAGRIFSEEAFAGDATRIKKAPESNPEAEYVMPQSKIFYTATDLINQAAEARLIDQIPEALRTATNYMDLSLGSTHLFKAAFEIYSTALDHGKTPQDAAQILKNQFRLIVLPEDHWEEAIEEVIANKYYGFSPEKILFMVQAKFPGFTIINGKAEIAEEAPKKIWNHGALKMQEAIPGEIFRASHANDGSIVTDSVSKRELDEILEGMEDGVSYSIEDMSLIESGQVADPAMINFAVSRRETTAYEFLMECVLQNPTRPQKGGFLAWRTYSANMYETSMSDTLIDITKKGKELDEELRKIRALNRNFNHIMALSNLMGSMREVLRQAEIGRFSAPMEQRILGFPHPELKDGYLYPQPPQGDINFTLETVFAAKDPVPQIKGLKVQDNIPMALNALYHGFRQTGFSQFVEDVLNGLI